MSILVLNTGSSSLKFALFDPRTLESLVSGEVDWKGKGKPAEMVIRRAGGPEEKSESSAAEPGAAASEVIARVVGSGFPALSAIGHRVVHGGLKFRQSVLIDDAVLAEIDHLSELAPLHNPPAVEAIKAARSSQPEIPQVAAFDTSFFANLPRSAATYPVPRSWTDDWGIRRFGFHGISHSYCAGKAAEILGRHPSSGLRLVICHLGNGCSASAVHSGRAIDTTMGFTPMTGLMMGTRAGSVDPGILLYLLKENKLNSDQIDDALNHQSGLLGVSGVSSDYREVEKAARSGNEPAQLALEMYASRVRSSIGSLAATLGGIDALVFAAGVGEHSATLRAAATEGLRFLGLALDGRKNTASAKNSDIAEDGSPARILVIHTEEELMIAREIQKLVPSTA